MESKYNNFISQFEILEKPPIKEGFHRHHIVPQSEQTEKDDRQVYLTLPQHMWAHILYDQENGTNTSKRFLTICNKPIDYFDSFKKCLDFSSILTKKNEERKRKSAEKSKTIESREKRSEAHKGEKAFWYGKHLSDETKRKISEHNQGRTQSEDFKKKMSEHMRGRVLTEEWKEKISKSNKGKPSPLKGTHFSEEHKRNISESMKGEKNHMYGKHLSKEQREKHSESMKGKNTWVKGRHWYNNGIEQTQADECPEGFWPGRLPFKKSFDKLE